MSNNSMSFAYDSIIFDKHRTVDTDDIEFIFNEEVVVQKNPLKIDTKLKVDTINDKEGNDMIDKVDSKIKFFQPINFNNVAISNLDLSGTSLNASSIGSSNGYASIDAELDALTTTQNTVKNRTESLTTNRMMKSNNAGILTVSDITNTNSTLGFANGSKIEADTLTLRDLNNDTYKISVDLGNKKLFFDAEGDGGSESHRFRLGSSNTEKFIIDTAECKVVDVLNLGGEKLKINGSYGSNGQILKIDANNKLTWADNTATTTVYDLTAGTNLNMSSGGVFNVDGANDTINLDSTLTNITKISIAGDEDTNLTNGILQLHNSSNDGKYIQITADGLNNKMVFNINDDDNSVDNGTYDFKFATNAYYLRLTHTYFYVKPLLQCQEKIESLLSTGEIFGSSDNDMYGTFGRAVVGYIGTADYAGFSHRDNRNATDYALAQKDDGETHINAKTGKSIKLKVNNTDEIVIDGTNTTFSNNIVLGSNTISSNDADLAFLFGRCKIYSEWSDYASFSHRDVAGSDGSQYALLQYYDGTTYLNSGTGKKVYIRTGAGNRIVLDDDKALFNCNIDFDSSHSLFFQKTSGYLISSEDADLYAEIGRCAIGFDSTNTDECIFSHIDCRNGTDYALRQTDGGDTVLNCKTGKSLNLNVNNTNIIDITATDVSIKEGMNLNDNDIYGLNELRFTANQTAKIKWGTNDSIVEYDVGDDYITLGADKIMIDDPMTALSSTNYSGVNYYNNGYHVFNNRWSVSYNIYKIWIYYYDNTFRQCILPNSANYGSVGNSSYYWRYGYFKSCYSDDFDAISDKRLKKDIKQLTEDEENKYYNGFKKLRVSKYKWKYQKEDKDNYHCCNPECLDEHIGLIAQDVKSIDNNVFCHCLNYDEEKIVSEDDLPAGETEKYHNEKAHLKNQQKIKDVMSIKQNQLMGIMINVIQQNQKKIEKLERRISILESK